ncbi:MAG: 30S ribosomal protein S12 methylthiotransferase RimO, partial [Campylobacter sp.]|nr:30S ribosomal protein S12 methylthiotransferase RimO [Campylobacter sp.]
MEQIPTRVITKRLNKIEKIVDKAILASFESLVGTTQSVEITGISSESEFFMGAKLALWDKDIDGEILINESEIENLHTGDLCECEITEFVGGKLLGRVVKKL